MSIAHMLSQWEVPAAMTGVFSLVGYVVRKWAEIQALKICTQARYEMPTPKLTFRPFSQGTEAPPNNVVSFKSPATRQTP